MRVKKEAPAKDLYIALLDDDPEGSCRPEIFASYLKEKGLSEKINLLVTDKVSAFINFCESHSSAVLFADPGALGDTRSNVDKKSRWFNNDRHLASWLRENPSRILYVGWILSLDYYHGVETFELPNIEAFYWEIYKVEMLLDKWLFENNPVRLFRWNWADYSDAVLYINKLKNPALTAVCENLSIRESTLGVRTIKEKKQALVEHYDKVWRESMKRRGVKV